VLKAEWSSVHEDACKLEHALTKNVAALLDEKLGYPKFCPHGNPIPTENGLIDEHPSITLTDANLIESYIVDRITNEEQKDLELLAEKRITPKATIQITASSKDVLFLSVEGKEQTLNKTLAANVMVRKLGANNDAV